MNRIIPHEQRQNKVQRVELLLTALLVAGAFLVGWKREWLPALVAVYVLLTLVLYALVYRSMDEFRRLRWLKSWAAAAHTGLATIVAWFLWQAFRTPTSDGLPIIALPLESIYLPIGVMAVTQLGVTAYLYWRDTRG